MRFTRIAALGSVAAMALALASIATSPTLAEINGMKAHAEKTVTEADGNPPKPAAATRRAVYAALSNRCTAQNLTFAHSGTVFLAARISALNSSAVRA